MPHRDVPRSSNPHSAADQRLAPNYPEATTEPSSRAGSVLSYPHKHPLITVATGNALEFYNFVTYAFFAVQIGRTFFPTQSAYASLMLSLATFGAGFVTRPIGAWIIGAYADRVGRRAAMTLSFVLMGIGVCVLALTPSYASIGFFAPALALVARLVQGFSLGGEVGPATAFLLEAAPPNRRGRIVAWQGASQGIAGIIGGAVGVGLSTLMTPASLDAYGWRIAFLLGAVMLPFALWMRLHLPETLEPGTNNETPSLASTGASQHPCAPAPSIPSSVPFLRTHARVVVVGLLFCASGTITTYIRHYMTTFAEHTLHIDTTVALAATVAGNGAAVVAILWGGWLSDHIGRRPAMFWPNLACLLGAYPTFHWIVVANSATSLLLGSVVLGALTSIAIGAFYPALTESLPHRARSRALATIYALSIATFGGTAQLVVTWLIHVTGNPLAPAWYLVAAVLVGQMAIVLMRESAPHVTAGVLPAAEHEP